MSKTTPKLRFPQFIDEWQAKKLGDIASFSKGAGISKEDINKGGKQKAIRYGELYTLYNEVIDTVHSATNAEVNGWVLSKAGDVIIPASGETSIDIARAACVLHDDIALGGDINIIRSSQNGVFMSYYLNNIRKKDIARLAQGVSVIHLYATNLKQVKLRLPASEEQEKIADFLTSVAERIGMFERRVELLTQYKKGMMQKIFTQQIRFKNENGEEYPDWETKRLGELLDYKQPTRYIVDSTEYNDSYGTPVLTAGKTFILGYTNETDGIFEDNLPVIIFDDFTTASHLVDFPFKVKSSAMKILKAKPGVNIKVAYELLKQIRFIADDHKRHWIGTFQSLATNIPSEEEQQKIADFLTSLDGKIKVEEEKLRQAKNVKKSLIQRMFV